MATIVRLVGYYVTPWSSVDGERRGDLLTEPLIYTLSVTISALITLNCVYPPIFQIVAVVLLAIVHAIYPSFVSVKRIPTVVAAAVSKDNKLA